LRPPAGCKARKHTRASAFATAAADRCIDVTVNGAADGVSVTVHNYGVAIPRTRKRDLQAACA